MLRWHEANGTYPARTIKATLYDNEEGGLVGSGDYSAAGGGATLAPGPGERRRHEHQGRVRSALNAAGPRASSASVSPVAIDDATPRTTPSPRSARRRRTTTLRRGPPSATRTSRSRASPASRSAISTGSACRRTTSTRPWHRSAPLRAPRRRWPAGSAVGDTNIKVDRHQRRHGRSAVPRRCGRRTIEYASTADVRRHGGRRRSTTGAPADVTVTAITNVEGHGHRPA